MSAVVLLGVLSASCGSDGANSTLAEESNEVTVFAAASLTAAFTEIGEAFMSEYSGTTVRFNFAASSDLVTQIGEGAPADVFASADPSSMTKLTDAGDNATEPVMFAKNSAAILVEAGNPNEITGVSDLANEDLIVVVCAPEVPCGKYAATIFENAGVTVTPKSLEENVKAVVTKVALGEADAGIVYATDVIAAGSDAEGIEIPAEINVVAEYPIAITKGAPNAAGAGDFVDFVVGEQGQAIMVAYGFLPTSSPLLTIRWTSRHPYRAPAEPPRVKRGIRPQASRPGRGREPR